MVQSLSLLESYEQSKFSWMITGGHLYKESDKLPQNTTFGSIHIGIEDLGFIKSLENKHIAARKHLLHGMVIEKTPTRLEDKIIASYRRQTSSDEEGPRRKWLERAAEHNPGQCLLEQTLQRLSPADVYIGLKGKMYALKESMEGSFRFGNKRYAANSIGSTTKVCAQHEQAVHKYLRNNKTAFAIESQELSSLRVSINGTSYTAQLTLEPFAMYTPEGIFSFDRCVAEYAFTVKKNAMSFTDIPEIVQPVPYTHPFVWYNSNSICFNGTKRWEDAKISLGTVISKKNTERNIAFVAAETARMLRGSYTVQTTPAHRLEDMGSRKITEAESIQKRLVVYGTE